jgi:hypothetical protein
MSKKKHAPHPTPRANRTTFGPGANPVDDDEAAEAQCNAGAPQSEQDPKRRLGDFVGTGEHAFVQPGGKNDAEHGASEK